jgi:hypothetical protein
MVKPRTRVSLETATQRITLARGDEVATAMLLDVSTLKWPLKVHNKGAEPACQT